MQTLVICSGGLDSVVLAYETAQSAQLDILVSFDYGQRHRVELARAADCAKALGCRHERIDISALGRLLSGSALTSDQPVPDGHYAEESMRATVVPNRNAILLTAAFGVASARGCQAVAIAVHGGDHFIYPDCRPTFISAFAVMQTLALQDMGEVTLQAPFVEIDKAEIVRRGAALAVPFAATWSCYKGGTTHCGRCGTCVERREAFALAEVEDPTEYLDPDYWRSAVRAHRAQPRTHE